MIDKDHVRINLFSGIKHHNGGCHSMSDLVFHVCVHVNVHGRQFD